MSERLIKPYEISVWENKLTQGVFSEKKLAIIGSNTMTGLNKVYNPVLNKKTNGEKTLTFSLKYKYFDPYIGNNDVVNPFAALLVNERKIKLYYDNEWYEFIIKEHSESSDNYEWTYTCTDAFVTELSKTGYNITFDTELNNNQGTAAELIEKTIKNTDWRLGNINAGKQMVAEPIYKAELKLSNPTITIINASNDGTAIPVANSNIYLFYSYIKNQDGHFVQFIIRDNNRNYTIDDKNVITDTNFRIKTELVYAERTENEELIKGFWLKNNNNYILVISIKEVETKYQANRLVYGQYTTYDPIMQRTVDRFKIEGGDREVYRYTDYLYTTSDVLVNYITNGENFNILEDGSLQGWNPYVGKSSGGEGQEYGERINKLSLITKPEISMSAELVDIAKLGSIEGYLKVQFNGILNSNYENTVYNSGFENNVSMINSVSKDEKYVFRWRARKGSSIATAVDADDVRLIVAKYTQDTPSPYNYYYKHIDPNNIILDFKVDSTHQIGQLDNIVTGGTLESYYFLTTDTEIVTGKTYYTRSGSGTEQDPYIYTIVSNPSAGAISTYYEMHYNYVIDGVVQTPSIKYRYEVINSGQSSYYIWSVEDNNYILENNNYLHYHYLIAEAKKSIPNSVLTDTTQKYGIFIYIENVSSGDREEVVVTEDYSSSLKEEIELPISPELITSGTKNIIVKYKDGNNVEHSRLFFGGTTDLSDAHIKYNANNTIVKIINNTVGIKNYEVKYKKIIPYYIQDIQLTRYIEDGETNEPITIGNVPTATTKINDYYYLKPDKTTLKEDIKGYSTIEALIDGEGLESGTVITPVRNEDSEKILSISASQSNCFNILQTIAETFECWIDLEVKHDSSGNILFDEDGLPKKFISLREYVGNDNWAGFKYGVNLQSIERNINSDEIVTKLIVDQSQSEYVDEGYVSIADASSNISGESYILNFDYYYSQGLLNKEETEEDRINYVQELATINKNLKELETLRNNYSMSLTKISDDRNVYTELIASAQEMQTDALVRFEDLTGQKYDEYIKKSKTVPTEGQDSETGEKELLEEETILEVVGEIYLSSSTINNYSGLLTNVEREYWDIRKKLYGKENYNVTIKSLRDINNEFHIIVELNDYLPGFSFDINNVSRGTSTVSKKYFDVNVGNIQTSVFITLHAPNDYTIEDKGSTYTYQLDANATTIFKIVTNESLEGIADEIEQLINQKTQKIKNFENKYSSFIQEGSWNSTEYIDSELYYLDALQVSNTSAQPTISYTINVVEISQLEGFEKYKFEVGDKTYVEDTEFFGWTNINIGTNQNPEYILTPAREEVIVSEVEWHLDEADKNTITVQNYKSRFEDLFQRINATVQTVQYNEATYAKISSLLDANGTINQNVLLDSMNRLAGKEYALTSDGSIIVEKDNILVRNLTNPANHIIINSEGICVSSNGGETYTTVINGQGINVDAVVTGTLNTNNVIIGNRDNPSFRWDKSGISAYGSEKIEIEGVEQDVYDLQTYVRYDQYGLYGIKNGETFKAQSLQDVLDKAHFAVTWDGFFIKNSYADGGRVSITSDNDFQITKMGNSNEEEIIKIGMLELRPNNVNGNLYGMRIKGKNNTDALIADSDGNLSITGIINATGGNFNDLITVGKDESVPNKPWIEIDGRDNINGVPNEIAIRSSKYNQDGASYGWMINADGDAVFNNITARGAIKTAVFEYAEIQAVGGIFIFRPSSTIGSARLGNPSLGESADNIIVTVKNPILFKDGQWCKVSNYASGDNDPDVIDPQTQTILQNNGLTHVYQISRTSGSNNITLLGAAAMINGTDAVISSVDKLIGGALIDMGNQNGTANYGIGINSSDNTVDLPARSISLFETVVDTTKEPKVAYRYKDVLGTLPLLPWEDDDEEQQVAELYNQYLKGTQGIYTDNMYLGDAEQYLAFYSDGNNKKLEIRADKILFKKNGEYENVANAVDATQGGHFIVKGSDTIKEGVITTHAGAGVIQNDNDDPALWGYNTWIGSNGIQLRRGETIDATLNINGLIVNHGGIEAGTPEENGFIYLSTEPYGEEYSIHGSTGIDDWKQIIGTKLGIRSDGTLYATNAHIADSIETESLRIGQWTTFDHRMKLCAGDYVATTDTEVFNDKVYFVETGDNKYERVTPAGSENPSTEHWYEYIEEIPSDWKDDGKTYYLAAKTEDDYTEVLVDEDTVFSGEYYLTPDQNIDISKTYYIRTGEGTDLDPYKYTAVNNPTGDPSQQGWYELQKLFYEKDMGSPQMVIGDKDQFAVTVDNTQITFWFEHQKVAFINGDKMEIPRSVMLEEMQIGQKKWSWREHESNLQLKWIGD